MSTLSDLVRDVLDETDATTPDEIASEMFTRIGDPAAALTEALPLFVRVTLSRMRMLSPLDASPDQDDKTTPQQVTRASRIRDDWAARLETPLRVGDEWKRLADCTAADLRTVAESLRGKAAKSLAKADWYDRLATMVPVGGTVASLTAAAVAA